VSALLASSSLDAPRQAHVVSVGQFRPEKDHERQLRAFALFLQSPFVQHRTSESLTTAAGGRVMATRSTAVLPSRPTLHLIGGCRDAQDEARVAALRALAVELGIQKDVQFHVNVDSTELTRLLTTSLVCLHTMWNEHFGISCVESMAAGTVLIAHNSGGPRADIVVDDSGMRELSSIDVCGVCLLVHMCTLDGRPCIYPHVQGYQQVTWPPRLKNMQNALNQCLRPTFPCRPDR
jgi:glycosyltransferase involved in cell wall biosynthesis